MTKEKQPVVRFTRHIRGYDYRGIIINNIGMALTFDLDYVKREVRFGYSICKGDNYNKKKGAEIATNRLETSPIAVGMPEDGIPQQGTTAYIIDLLASQDENLSDVRKFLRDIRSLAIYQKKNFLY